MAFDLSDYVDVAERIVEFRAKHPEGSLQSYVIRWPGEGFPFVVVKAWAFRTPDDPRPGIGIAAQLFPGRTPYTKDSEVQNAETSAWGRAIVAAGAADTKRGVASRNEIEASAPNARGAEPGAVQRDRGSSPAGPQQAPGNRSGGSEPYGEGGTGSPDTSSASGKVSAPGRDNPGLSERPDADTSSDPPVSPTSATSLPGSESSVQGGSGGPPSAEVAEQWALLVQLARSKPKAVALYNKANDTKLKSVAFPLVTTPAGLDAAFKALEEQEQGAA